jgi:hypothetical protein
MIGHGIAAGALRFQRRDASSTLAARSKLRWDRTEASTLRCRRGNTSSSLVPRTKIYAGGQRDTGTNSPAPD